MQPRKRLCRTMSGRSSLSQEGLLFAVRSRSSLSPEGFCDAAPMAVTVSWALSISAIGAASTSSVSSQKLQKPITHWRITWTNNIFYFSKTPLRISWIAATQVTVFEFVRDKQPGRLIAFQTQAWQAVFSEPDTPGGFQSNEKCTTTVIVSFQKSLHHMPCGQEMQPSASPPVPGETSYIETNIFENFKHVKWTTIY